MTLPAVNAGNPSSDRIECGHYDLDRFVATMNHAVGLWSTFAVPPDWNIASARRPTLAEFQPVINQLAQMRVTSAASTDYPFRQAFLTYSILSGSIWESPCREAVAYGTLRLGMWDHGYRRRVDSSDAHLLFCEPGKAFWLYGDCLEDLTALIRAAYVLKSARS